MKTSEHIGYLLIFLTGCLWGIIGVFVKQLEYYGATPVLTSFLRVFFAFLIMTAICMLKYGWKALFVDTRTLVSCALLGLICHGIYNIFYSLAVTMAGISVSAVLLNIAPVFTLLFSIVLFSETFTKIKVFAVILNVLGCILTATNGQFDFAVFSLIGILYGVGAGICYSLTAIIGRFAASHTNSFVMSMYSYFFAALFLGIGMKPWRVPVAMNAGILFWSILYALIPTALAYVIYYIGLQKVPESSKVPVIASMETVIASIIGIFLYHETIGLIRITGIFLVLISIAVMNIKAPD